MESKSIKVVDEHGIDRIANIICAIQVQNIDYAVYWIERDSENDNIFVSKLLKNIDDTSNLINIEDSIEKGKLSEIVKELIKYAVDNEETNISDKKVFLPNGEVLLTSVLVNKEQNINVQKTYITTVKKAVTKVACDFYKVSEEISASMPIFEDIPTSSPVNEEQTPIIPIIDIPDELFKENKEEDVKSVEAVSPEKVVNPVPEPSIVLPEIDLGLPKNPEATFLQSKDEFIPNPVTVTEPVLTESEPQPVMPTPVVEPQAVSVDEKINIVSNPSTVLMEDKSITPEPVLDVSDSQPTELIFDGSKESNLNQALGEVSKESPLPVQNVESIREFGVDNNITSTINDSSEIKESNQVDLTEKETTQSGFANNKFFMVVALIFFVASCVFLGYEVFRYLKLR